MKGHGEKLSRKKEKAIVALLTEPSVAEAAKKVEVAESTLFRWMQIREFNQAYRAAKRQAFFQTVGQLQQASADAVETLRSVMGDPQASYTSKVRAAQIVLEMANKGIETEDIDERLEEIEKRVERDVG